MDRNIRTAHSIEIFLALLLSLSPLRNATAAFSVTEPPQATTRMLSLNGRWQVAIGERCPERFVSEVPVPGIVSQAVPALGEDLDANGEGADVGYEWVWYRYDFRLDEAGAWPRALLHLRAKYNTKVLLNGVEIGEDRHTTYSHGVFDISRALNLRGENRLVVRVGSWNTASPPSRENSTEWWRNSRCPGIWDDVTLELSGTVWIAHVKALPDLRRQSVDCTIMIENPEDGARTVHLAAVVRDNAAEMTRIDTLCRLEAGTTTVALRLSGKGLQTWEPGREGVPKLYRVETRITDTRGRELARRGVRFGYRSIEVCGRDVLVNGRKLLFRAENIAFVRALNRWPDQLFDTVWIRRFIRAAVQDYGFNYLRMHLGHAYSRWYDIADEEGMMIQDEWRYMHDEDPQGAARADACTELTRWVEQNVNHPSIVAWDQENEGAVRLTELKERLRIYDPTRLWGEDDFDARHLYSYSETIVAAPEHHSSAAKPSTVFESCRLWINELGRLEPREAFKTSRTASGWGLYYYTQEDIERLQADLHADLGTFYRSRRVQAWAPFALLSGGINGHNYYRGAIADSLVPQANLMVLRTLNGRIGCSVEMLQAREWYKERRLYPPGSRQIKTIWVWNDTSESQPAEAVLTLRAPDGSIVARDARQIEVPPYGAVSCTMEFIMPRDEGVCTLIPTVRLTDGSEAEGPVRRLMCSAEFIPAIEELQAFGGRSRPVPGAHAILEHFARRPIPAAVQCRIRETVGDGLVDRVECPDNETGYSVQYTRYLAGKAKREVVTVDFDAEGTEQSRSTAEVVQFALLPAAVRTAIVEALGAVPVDEAKIVRTIKDGEELYEIRMVGDDTLHRLSVLPNGTLSKITRNGNNSKK